VIAIKRLFRPVPVFLALAALGGGSAIVLAQMEAGLRGIAPIDTSGSFEVTGVLVDVHDKTADAARHGGWRLAQRKAWRMLWAKYHGGAGIPALSDGTLDSIVSGIEVENEQIGPNRYIAKLGVLFDRARAGQILGVGGGVARSLPLLVIPLQGSGGRPQTFADTEWQAAWARFRAGSGSIDYVRPRGTGPDALLLNPGQVTRRSRIWWRALLDQYGAADVLVPKVSLSRQWPGGPVIGYFTACYGPDDLVLTRFTLRAENSAALAQMLDEGVKRMDEAYSSAQVEGRLRPDPTLIIEEPVDPADLEEEEGLLEEMTPGAGNAAIPSAGSSTITIQFETPDAAAVSRGESAVRGLPGIGGAETTSLAIGGFSVMRVTYAGDAATLRQALSARGWRVEEAGSGLRIRRAPPASQGVGDNVSGG